MYLSVRAHRKRIETVMKFQDRDPALRIPNIQLTLCTCLRTSRKIYHNPFLAPSVVLMIIKFQQLSRIKKGSILKKNILDQFLIRSFFPNYKLEQARNG